MVPMVFLTLLTRRYLLTLPRLLFESSVPPQCLQKAYLGQVEPSSSGPLCWLQFDVPAARLFVRTSPDRRLSGPSS